MQNNRSVPLEISPHCYTLRCPGPPRMSATARERTYVAARRATRVGDRSHAQSSRRGTGTNHIRHQEVTGRRYTGLLVTFSRPIESTCAPCTGPEEERGRPVLQATVGRLRLGLAHHPRPVGAGAGSALSRPSWAASLAHRPRSCGNQGHFVTPAASSVHEGDPMSSPRRLRHPRPCQRPGCRSRRRGASLQPSGAIWNGHSRTSGRWPGSCWPALYSVRGERSLLRAYVG